MVAIWEAFAMSASNIRKSSGASSTLAAFLVGVPLGVLFLYGLSIGMIQDEYWNGMLERYLHHGVEKVELVMFCAALGALGAKWIGTFRQKAGLKAELIPKWDGKPVAPSQASVLLQKYEETLSAWSHTWIGKRYLSALDFVKSRGTANELDDHLRTLADADAMSLEASYSLTRFITWAIPILGFLGTVLGITDAITGVTPEKLEKDMSAVTGGLSLAFDATALGLGLTMVLMFISFLVERTEQRVLELVDVTAEDDLGHRFSRAAADHAPLLTAMESSSQHMFDTAEGLVRRQSELWAKSLEHIANAGRESAKEQYKHLVTGLESAVGGALAKHSQRLGDLESQMLARQEKMLGALNQVAEILQATSQSHQKGVIDVTQKLSQQTTALAQLQQTGAELTRLQETLAQNLNTLAGSGAFEEAVQSLTAAIHLLTTRVATPKKAA